MKNAKHLYNKKSLSNAKKLRKEMTEFETKFWHRIKNRQIFNLKFRRQVPLGDYIVDFICKEEKIIIELDGSGHLETKQIEHDKERDNYLKSLGYRIIRVFNNESTNIEGVFEKIKELISPLGEREIFQCEQSEH